MVKPGSTRTQDRLIDATLELVAARGFAGVSVGDIEAGAGLAPRSGALYKYFDSKLAVLEAGLERHLDAIADIDAELASALPGDATIEVEALVRWLLAELDSQRTIMHVIEREGERLPELRDRMREGISDRGYRIAAVAASRWASAAGFGPVDPDALAVLLIGGLVNLRRSTWTFGTAPLAIEDERVIATFVALSTALLSIDPAENRPSSR